MYQYKLKEGHEDRVFINTRRLADNTIESSEELNSPFLELLKSDAPPVAEADYIDQPQPLVGTVSQANPDVPVEQNTNTNEENN